MASLGIQKKTYYKTSSTFRRLTRATIEVHHFCFWGSSIWELNAFSTGNPLGTNLLEVSIERDFGALKGLIPKTIFWRKTKMLPDEKSYGLVTQRES